MTKKKLFIAVIFVLHVIGLLVGIYFYSVDEVEQKTDQKTDQKPMARLTASVQSYWQAEQRGQWTVCYSMFSHERIKELKESKPEIFKDEKSFVTERTKAKAIHPIEQIKILEIKYSNDGLRVLVMVGVKIKGRGKTIVKQHWLYNSAENRWLIGVD